MMTVNLETYGFDSSSNKVYNYLLSNVGRLSAKSISETLNMPSKAVYAALKQLEKNNLIEAFEDDYPKLFSVQNPAHTLSQLIEGQIEKRKEEIRLIRTELDKAQALYLNQFIKGSCKRQVSFYYFHDTTLASSFLSQHLSAAQSEILVNLVPKHILSQYFEILNQLARNNVWVGVYLNQNDLEIVSDLGDQIKAFMVDTSDQQYVSVDNRIFQSGNILIDQKRFVSIEYNPQGSDWILSSFLDFKVVENIKVQIRKRAYQDAREIFNVKAQTPILARITKLLSEKKDLSKQELADLLQISGKQLNKYLSVLEEKERIQIKKISKGKGRPQERILLIQ
jgi:predicted ArsR family transcriptional regulator